MYKIFILLILFLSNLFSNNISWYGSYDKALLKAKSEKKNIILFVASSKDLNSKNILKEYFQKQDYIKYINENFINILVTIEYKTSYPIELFYTTKFPSVFFVSYKDESILTHPIYGMKDNKEFIRNIKQFQQLKLK